MSADDGSLDVRVVEPRPATSALAEDPARPVFLYDLVSPEAYLAAERVIATLPVVPEWRPVWRAGLPGGAAPPGGTDVDARAMLEARARAQGLQPLRWPPGWPGDTRVAMLAATFARRSGRAVAFSLAAFRQAFAAGHDLADPDVVAIAGAACELHPRALLRAVDTRAVADALDRATAAAAARGVDDVPALIVGDAVFQGEDAPERATDSCFDDVRRSPQ